MSDECRRIVTHLSDLVAHTARLGDLLERLGVRSCEGRKLGRAHGVADEVLVVDAAQGNGIVDKGARGVVVVAGGRRATNVGDRLVEHTAQSEVTLMLVTDWRRRAEHRLTGISETREETIEEQDEIWVRR